MKEPIETSIDELRRLSLAKLNETLWVVESDFPECYISRKGKSVICEPREHISSFREPVGRADVSAWSCRLNRGAICRTGQSERPRLTASMSLRRLSADTFEMKAKANNWVQATPRERARRVCDRFARRA